MRLSCVIINLTYQIHLKCRMWYDLQKDSFLTTSLKLAKSEHTYIFHLTQKSIFKCAIASMLFDASSCSMFDFQCSTFDSAIFILFCMLNLH